MTVYLTRLNILILIVFDVNCLICHSDRIVVPKTSREGLVLRTHEQHGHKSFDKLPRRLRQLYFWPKMDNYIQKICQECPVCQLTKTRITNRPELGEIADFSTIQPLKFWSIDFQGPFRTSKSGNRFIIVAIDYASKWVEALCTSDATAVKTAQFIILRHGTPDTIHTDQGTNFESKLIDKIKKTLSSPYHPQGNGAIERENRSIKELLRSYTRDDQRNWDSHVPSIVHTRNTNVHSSTGFSPYEIVYARKSDTYKALQPPAFEPTSEYIANLTEARKAIESAARSQMIKEQAKRKKAYEKLNPISYQQIEIGDQVVITNESSQA